AALGEHPGEAGDVPLVGGDDAGAEVGVEVADRVGGDDGPVVGGVEGEARTRDRTLRAAGAGQQGGQTRVAVPGAGAGGRGVGVRRRSAGVVGGSLASRCLLLSAARSAFSARAWRGGRARRSTSPTVPAQRAATSSQTRIIAGGTTTSTETRRCSGARGRSVDGAAHRSSTMPSVSLPEKRTRTLMPGPAAAVSGVTAYSKGRSRCGSTPTRRTLATGSSSTTSKPAVVRRPDSRAAAGRPGPVGAADDGVSGTGTAGAAKRGSCPP